jgi:tetratricopeptide (TPR) repeat protein
VWRRLIPLLSLIALGLPLGAETVLILPFFNVSKAQNLDWIGDSLSETILEAFAAEGVGVVPPESRDEVLRQMSVRRYARLTRASVMEIAVNCDAGMVLYGEFDFTAAPAGGPSKGGLRVALRVLDVRRMKRGAEFNVTGPLEELSTLQSRLAWQSLHSLSPDSTETAEDYLRSHPPVRIDALESYVRGLLATQTDLKYKLFTNAVRLEPAYSQPCFHLGKLNYAARTYRGAADWLQKVNPADIHYREALFFLGLSRYHTGSFQGAAEVLRKLAGTVPLAEVLNNLGAAQLRTADPGAAESFLKAVEMDPADPVYHFNAGYALWRKGAYEQAADSFRSALQRKPEDGTATLMLGRCLKQQGPRPGDLRTEALERLKTEYNETAWLALKSMLAPKAQ